MKIGKSGHIKLVCGAGGLPSHPAGRVAAVGAVGHRVGVAVNAVRAPSFTALFGETHKQKKHSNGVVF